MSNNNTKKPPLHYFQFTRHVIVILSQINVGFTLETDAYEFSTVNKPYTHFQVQALAYLVTGEDEGVTVTQNLARKSQQAELRAPTFKKLSELGGPLSIQTKTASLISHVRTCVKFGRCPVPRDLGQSVWYCRVSRKCSRCVGQPCVKTAGSTCVHCMTVSTTVNCVGA